MVVEAGAVVYAFPDMHCTQPQFALHSRVCSVDIFEYEKALQVEYLGLDCNAEVL